MTPTLTEQLRLYQRNGWAPTAPLYRLSCHPLVRQAALTPDQPLQPRPPAATIRITSDQGSPWPAIQYVYHMENVSKTYPGGKKCFESIHLNFLPGVKIGVVKA